MKNSEEYPLEISNAQEIVSRMLTLKKVYYLWNESEEEMPLDFTLIYRNMWRETKKAWFETDWHVSKPIGHNPHRNWSNGEDWIQLAWSMDRLFNAP